MSEKGKYLSGQIREVENGFVWDEREHFGSPDYKTNGIFVFDSLDALFEFLKQRNKRKEPTNAGK